MWLGSDGSGHLFEPMCAHSCLSCYVDIPPSPHKALPCTKSSPIEHFRLVAALPTRGIFATPVPHATSSNSSSTFFAEWKCLRPS